MFASPGLRFATRRAVSTVTRQASSSTRQSSTLLKIGQSQQHHASRNALLTATAGLAVVVAAIHDNETKTYNLWNNDKSNNEKNNVTQAVKATEEKFGTYWPRNIMILFGPPGAGKGTHGPKIEQMLDIPQLSTGDMLRAAVADKTEVGKKAEAVMKAGGLVSDEIVIGIIRDRIQHKDCQFGFILDGFPRTVTQAKALDKMLAQEGARVTKVIELSVPDSVLEERITGRWIHKESGRSYHVKYAPPKSMKTGKDGKTPVPESMKDDETGQPLMQRKDDTSQALIKRLQGYHNETVPILDHYRPDGIVREVNANQGMSGVWKEILSALQRSA